MASPAKLDFRRRSVRVGLFQVDFEAREILKSGRKVKVQDQPFLVLEMLLQRAGEIVTREELQAKLWPEDTYVGFDDGLNTAIRKLRLVFGDSADNPRFIETIPRRGYRFIAPVGAADSLAEKPTDISAASSRPKGSLPAWALAVAVVLLLLIGIPGIRSRIVRIVTSKQAQPAPYSAIHSVAVLPLENLSDDRGQDFFADGMTDQLITSLGQIKALRVISRTSVMRYKGVRKSAPRIGRELQVDAVVEGTILRSGDQVRITAQLIDARLDKHLWAQSYQSDLRDVLRVQNNVAAAIAQEIRITLTPGERAVLEAGRQVNPEAYENYLQGRYFWNKRDGGAMEKAIEYFQRAIKLDPEYAPAYAGLAQTYVLLAGSVGPKQDFVAEAKMAAKQALSLDPNLAEAHTALALVYGNEWDFTAEEREFKLAVALDPSYATGHHWYGEGYLAQIGRFEEANHEMQQALALDPASTIIATDWGATLFLQRRYDEAYQQLSNAISMNSAFSEAYTWRAKVLLQQGRYLPAIADFETAYRINKNEIIASYLAYAYGVSGNRAEATSRLRTLLKQSAQKYVSPWGIGMAYLGVGDHGHALDWFEAAVREHSPHMPAAKVAPEYDPLRSEPRFQEMLLRMRLPS